MERSKRVTKLDGVEYESLSLFGRDREVWKSARRPFVTRVLGWFQGALRGRNVDTEAQSVIRSAVDGLKALLERPVLVNQELAARVAELRSKTRISDLTADDLEKTASTREAQQVIHRITEVIESKKYLQRLIEIGAIQVLEHDAGLVVLIAVNRDPDE